jgi:predicted porin
MMNRKIPATLTALAVIFFGFTAFAADEAPTVKGNVEIYGQAKISVDLISTDAKAANADDSLIRVSSNSSRLGFKSKEELSDDLSTVMQIELGIGYDGASASPSYRNSYGGLSSKTFGTILFGIHDTPYKMSTGSLDAFGDTMGDFNAMMGNVNGSSDFDQRAKNEIMYMSPKWSGFHFNAASSVTGSETDSGAGSNSSLYSVAASYGAGPLYVTLADEIHKNGYTSWDDATTVTGTKAGVGYTFGDTKVGLVYESLKSDTPDSQFTRNAMYLSLKQKLGNETLKLAYGSAADGEDPTTETGAKLTVIGLDHTFSKRTTAYILYAKTDNDKDATYGLGQSGAGGAYKPSAGESPSVISIGMNHNF